MTFATLLRLSRSVVAPMSASYLLHTFLNFLSVSVFGLRHSAVSFLGASILSLGTPLYTWLFCSLCEWFHNEFLWKLLVWTVSISCECLFLFFYFILLRLWAKCRSVSGYSWPVFFLGWRHHAWNRDSRRCAWGLARPPPPLNPGWPLWGSALAGGLLPGLSSWSSSLISRSDIKPPPDFQVTLVGFSYTDETFIPHPFSD